jgi:hypothetical protein
MGQLIIPLKDVTKIKIKEIARTKRVTLKKLVLDALKIKDGDA